MALFTRSRTDLTPGTDVAVSTSWVTRAERLEAFVPVAKRSPRSMVATPLANETLRSGVPAGTALATSRFRSADVGPASTAVTAWRSVEPVRLT